MKVLRLWFSLAGRVSRKDYITSGFGLMALKYALDAGIVFASEGHLLLPYEFLSPLLTTRERLLGQAGQGPMAAMLLLALPFLWIGVSMSVRRAVDAGMSPWSGLLFVLPFVNLILMVTLCIAPSRGGDGWSWPVPTNSSTDRVKSALFGFLVGICIAALMMGLSVLLLEEYNSILFFSTPFVMGAASAYVFNHGRPRSVGSSLMVGSASILVACGALLLFALEGIVCIAMALPIAAGAGAIGALIGRAIAAQSGGMSAVWPLLLALPLTTAMSAAIPEDLSEREVVTAVEIDAPPEVVWRNVVGFSELPPPPELVFRLGIAYPKRAVIEGEGVGAVRRCEFSTGAFVEPITRWEPPRRLSFEVESQPPPMHEWSPYRHVHPPHLDGYLRSRRGEFRLVRLPGDRTRLEGSTWYTLDLNPAAYWALWSDRLIHQIHRRVLEHIQRLSEREHRHGLL